MVKIVEANGPMTKYSIDPKKENVDAAFKDVCKDCRLYESLKSGVYGNKDDMTYCAECRALAKRKAAKGKVFEVGVIVPKLPRKLQQILEVESMSSALGDVKRFFE